MIGQKGFSNSNANLGDETCTEDVLEGLKVVQEAAGLLNLPVCAVCAKRQIAGKLPDGLPPVFVIERFLKPEWMEV